MEINDCDCVILCGGLGKRLRSVVSDTPKVMAEVNGRPFMDHVIGHVASQGIERIVLCTGYKAQMIEDYYRDHDFGITIDYSREDKPLGTGGALKNARAVIKSDPFLVLNGDSFLPADLKGLLEFHAAKKAEVTLTVTLSEQVRDFGSVSTDAKGRVTAFSEKSADADQAPVNAGLYCMNQSVFDRMPKQAAFSLETDLFPQMTDRPFYGFQIDGTFLDIGTPQRYASVKQQMKKE